MSNLNQRNSETGSGRFGSIGSAVAQPAPLPSSVGQAPARSEAAQKVLRNTYGLLALSMVPTIAGAWIGVQMNLGSAIASLGAGMSAMLFLAIAFGFIFAIQKNRDSALGVGLLLAFTGVMGAMLSPLLAAILGRSNGVSLIMMAAGGTAGVFAAMASLASVIKRDLSGMGKFLFVGVLLLLFASLANIFLQSSALMITLSTIAVGLFSAYLLYDMKRILDGGETNYVSATLSIYLDLFNIFQNLLALLGIGSSD